MTTVYITMTIVVALTLAFDFINGFHDTANAIATLVSTRALRPRIAIVMASCMNFVGALSFTGVARTIGGSVADPSRLQYGQQIVMAALLGAIVWNLITWKFGIPSSSSHALIGGLAGAVIASEGFGAINAGGFAGIIKGLIVSPFLAFGIGYALMQMMKLIFAGGNPHKLNKRFRVTQIATGALQSFTHGTNDAQKGMGIITFALVSAGLQDDLEVPLWVKLAAATAIALGTSAGGMKIIRTLGTKIFKIEPINGFTADLSSAGVIFGATWIHFPVSTTHVITSSILGVGSAKRFSSVKWDTALRIVISWIITIPIAMTMSALAYELIYWCFLR